MQCEKKEVKYYEIRILQRENNTIELLECIVIASRFLRSGKKMPSILERKFLELDNNFRYGDIEMALGERESFEIDYKDMKNHMKYING